MKGKYLEFEVVSSTFGVVNHLFTGAPNALDITGGMRTVVFARKTPDHRGLTLTGPLSVELKGADIVIGRTGPGLSMKIQAKDCANGGLFQMEPQRGDGTATGEDAGEVAPPATVCTQNCQAQNRVKGQSVKLGFPFPVPDTSRLQPRFPTGFTP